jgi:hypothetical protein
MMNSIDRGARRTRSSGSLSAAVAGWLGVGWCLVKEMRSIAGAAAQGGGLLHLVPPARLAHVPAATRWVDGWMVEIESKIH